MTGEATVGCKRAIRERGSGVRGSANAAAERQQRQFCAERQSCEGAARMNEREKRSEGAKKRKE